MKTLRKAMRRSTWLCLLLSISLTGCWSYISREAQHEFQALEGPFSVTVYPVNVVKGTTVEHDEDLALRLMAFLREENLANPVLGTAAVEIPVTWRRNQAKMAQQSAIAFATEVKTTGVQTEYALLVEILCNSTETKVRGVHFYLSDRTGNLASGGLTNSHWEEFQEVQPHDRQGGNEVAIRMLRRIWKRH
jgi:hypothetical protein